MRASHVIRDGHQIRLLEGGREYFAALMAALDQAREEVHLETYIFDFHGTGTDVAEALVRAAQRGVRVRVVVDGVGSSALSADWRERFAQAGVEWRVYAPLSWLGLLIPSRWRRLHRKLCVVDGQLAFCGGINILDDLYDPYQGPLDKPRLDFAVSATGALVQQVREATSQLWWRMQTVRDMREHHFPAAFHAFKTAGVHLPWTEPDRPQEGTQKTARAGLLLRDNVLHRGHIEKAYCKAIGLARQEIVIANAYFVPGRKVRKALIHAAGRGVRVRLLLQGRYEYFMQFHAVRPVYGALLAAGVEIHEYTASFLHAKVAVIDAHHDRPWATVGSSNLEPLSLLMAREANVVVADGPFAQQLHARLLLAIAQESVPVAASVFADRPRYQRILDGMAYGLMRAVLFVMGKRY